MGQRSGAKTKPAKKIDFCKRTSLEEHIQIFIFLFAHLSYQDLNQLFIKYKKYMRTTDTDLTKRKNEIMDTYYIEMKSL